MGPRAGVQPADDGPDDAAAAGVDDDRAAGCHDAVAGGAVQDAAGHAEEDGGDVHEEGVSAEWTCAVDRAPRVCDSSPAVPCGAGWGRITQACTADVEFVDSVLTSRPVSFSHLSRFC